MDFVIRCLCSKREDFLNGAPCPPPFFPLLEFHEHACKKSLLVEDICSIAERCYTNRPAINLTCHKDCPSVSPSPDDEIATGGTAWISIPIIGSVVIVALVITIIIFVLRLRYKKVVKDRKSNNRTKENILEDREKNQHSTELVKLLTSKQEAQNADDIQITDDGVPNGIVVQGENIK